MGKVDTNVLGVSGMDRASVRKSVGPGADFSFVAVLLLFTKISAAGRLPSHARHFGIGRWFSFSRRLSQFEIYHNFAIDIGHLEMIYYTPLRAISSVG